MEYRLRIFHNVEEYIHVDVEVESLEELERRMAEVRSKAHELETWEQDDEIMDEDYCVMGQSSTFDFAAPKISLRKPDKEPNLTPSFEEVIREVLDNNDGRCLDDADDREALVESLLLALGPALGRAERAGG